jgi:hypothetical protein
MSSGSVASCSSCAGSLLVHESPAAALKPSASDEIAPTGSASARVASNVSLALSSW